MKKFLCLLLVLFMLPAAASASYSKSDCIGTWVYSAVLSDGLIMAVLVLTDDNIAYYLEGMFIIGSDEFRYNRQSVGTWDFTSDGLTMTLSSGEAYSGRILFDDYIALPMAETGYFIFGKCADLDYIYNMLK